MYGLDSALIDGIDFSSALKRVKTDVLSDFVLAPHYSAVYEYAGDELIERLKTLLRNGEYAPELPIKVDVPKTSGVTRPGAILLPVDRLTYQMLADQTSTIIESQLDRSRVFSHVLLTNDTEFKMFRPSSECWQEMETARNSLCQSADYQYAVKTDVSCYFERINQHNLINLLGGSGCDNRITNLLEKILLDFTEKDSYGILQGLFPSDLFGNFYLSVVDNHLNIKGVPSIRYVDDLYVYYPTLTEAKKGLVDLCRTIRDEGLSLNESKTKIMEASALFVEETEIDRLFQRAREEIRNTPVLIEVEGQYGFESIWVTGELGLPEEEIELRAVKELFSTIGDNPSEAEKIERFCLPYFSLSRDNIAVESSLERIIKNPHLSRMYCSYLIPFVRSDRTVSEPIELIIRNEELPYDWSLIWPLALLIEVSTIDESTVVQAIRIIEDSRRADALRATAVHLVAKHGNAMQRRLLRHRYDREPSQYVRSAILYSARYLTTNERNSCLGAWGSHSVTNSLIVNAVRASIN